MLIVFWGGDVEGTMWERKLLLCVLTADMCRPGQRRSGPSCDFTLGGYAVCISAGAHPPPRPTCPPPFSTLSPAYLLCYQWSNRKLSLPFTTCERPLSVPLATFHQHADCLSSWSSPEGGFTQDMKWDWAQHTFIGLWTEAWVHVAPVASYTCLVSCC